MEAPAGSTRAAVTAVGGSAGPRQVLKPKEHPSWTPTSGPSYPEHTRLFSGGLSPNRVPPRPHSEPPRSLGPLLPEGVYGELDRPGAWLCPTEGLASCRPPSTLLRRLCIRFKGKVGAGPSPSPCFLLDLQMPQRVGQRPMQPWS